jgi:hypothetical protein
MQIGQKIDPAVANQKFSPVKEKTDKLAVINADAVRIVKNSKEIQLENK